MGYKWLKGDIMGVKVDTYGHSGFETLLENGCVVW